MDVDYQNNLKLLIINIFTDTKCVSHIITGKIRLSVYMQDIVMLQYDVTY
jgi:hypothetical protein